MSHMPQQTASPGTRDSLTARLLACGLVVGPLFVVMVLVQAVTREGFDLTYHPISLLSLGELGWMQIADFVVAGLLCVAFAVGVRRMLGRGRGGTWGPRLIGLTGIGMITAGVFTSDPGAGFPPGAPAGAPASMSWHGILHEVAFAVVSLSWLAACFVFLRRFAALKRRAWVAACVLAPVAVVVLVAWPDLDGLSVRLVVASAMQFGFLFALAADLLRGRQEAGSRGA
ncbi:DUF998 domain-containing protein [Nonomuraea sp. NBC_00507]|uniref:DUF998 domain-containing protein n=1 Tax=Nonomuraea sp. NBC_00507 TaxID=2976002 RepID=UPI002E19DA42